MKKLIYLVALLQNFWCYAQVSEEGFPLSKSVFQLKKGVEIPHFQLKNLEVEKLNREDELNNTPLRYSQFEDVNIDIKDGLDTKISNPNGDIWQYKIVADSAVSIQIIFKTFIIPPDAKLFIYNEDYSLIYGAFTDKNMEQDSVFVVSDFNSKSLILEYFEPENAPFKGTLIIGSIGQAYKDIFNQMADAEGYIGINCPEGKDWQTEKHAVCKITFKIGQTGYLCSGSLINNTKNDKTPYFLTANHCISTLTSARSIVVYFNYEQEGCNGNNTTFKTLSGSTLMTNGNASDYSLLKLNTIPPASYKPYYAGWDIGDTMPLNAAGIHHPSGLFKKLSIDYNRVTTYNKSITWDEGGTTPAFTHWEVGFDIGLTAGGSSGSPLFNDKKLIIGQLHGGSDNVDYYGKLSYSWTNPITGSNKLRQYLDPDNTGVTILPGFAPSTNSPDASFSCNFIQTCTNAETELNDNSAFNPLQRVWSFNPTSVIYTGGTTKNSKDPKVKFTSPGNYTVKLKVTNSNGSDSSSISSFIEAGNIINVEVISPTIDQSCFCNFDSLIVSAKGADTYSWELSPNDYFINSDYESNSQIIKLKNILPFDSTQALNMQIIGQQGICMDTITFSYKLIQQINDNIDHALKIEMGKNGLFSNKCATVQTNEPAPPDSSCTSQHSWCDEYGDGSKIVEHSVWFYFTGPSSGIAGIKSDYIDGELAVYSANSIEDILNGNFEILGANDDFAETDPIPSISSVTVIPNQKYWVQFDGSGGGTEGNFNIYLYDFFNVSLNKTDVGAFKLYPQPTDNFLIIESNEFAASDQISVEIFSLTGSLLISDQIQKQSANSLLINTSSLDKGLYFFRLLCDGKSLSGKFIK
jgi:PKD repeat protein